MLNPTYLPTHRQNVSQNITQPRQTRLFPSSNEFCLVQQERKIRPPVLEGAGRFGDMDRLMDGWTVGECEEGRTGGGVLISRFGSLGASFLGVDCYGLRAPVGLI